MVFGLNKENADDVLTIFIAILMFQSIPRFKLIGGYFEKYPFIIFGIAILMLVKRKEIINFLGGNKLK